MMARDRGSPSLALAYHLLIYPVTLTFSIGYYGRI
ncbi:hypothetical protein AB7942_30465 [Neobacillus sp. BF23-41]